MEGETNMAINEGLTIGALAKRTGLALSLIHI